jgi:hypothetical protein
MCVYTEGRNNCRSIADYSGPQNPEYTRETMSGAAEEHKEELKEEREKAGEGGRGRGRGRGGRRIRVGG